MLRYPENTKADIEDFRRSDWKKAIEAGTRDGYHGMWRSLSNAARAAIENGKVSEGKVLWLLADACSMSLNPSSANEPFSPFIVMAGRRSSLPEDFQESDVTLLAQISEEVDDIWLQARLADLVWILKRPRSPQHALLAIDAYRKISMDAATWVHGARDCWERAINLTRMLGGGAGDRAKQIEETVTHTFGTAEDDHGFLALELSKLMDAYGFGYSNSIGIAEKLESLARLLEQKGELYRARELFESSAKWYKRAGINAKFAEMTACVAEGWAKEAIARVSVEKPSHMVAAGFYEKAIQTYRMIPRDERGILGVDDRIADLHRRMSEAGEKSLGEMGVIELPSFDISKIVEHSRDVIRGKGTTDALAAFCNIYAGFQVALLRESAEKMLREHPLQALISTTHMSRDGRVVAKRPGLGAGDTGSDEYKQTIWAEMINEYMLELLLVVQGRIWPALDVLVLEHRLRENDFISLASQSPIVPVEREHLFGKALFWGYERDFVGAIHILVPQIEHMVRCHLKARGAKTTNLDQNGIETENGLSTLMDLPEVEQIFGENLSFEIKALFCDAFGPNLRNDLAHGLLDRNACQSTYSIYAWWLGLKLVFNTFWNESNKRMHKD